ncbi:STAS domain-containing protein [Actinoplanes sp. TRM 88003]|uniref:STAS domain-containing protein n=1 Tax=Paractinoplanes aksuensis TaxID=2939490 RepID=A0ABT1DNR5_9ACTN|nr:STAS domain-containing protein [Actinoplanes aksuensis]MCO8271716.1 STAS domain-containing protein [Actinoplanes aksuensis]
MKGPFEARKHDEGDGVVRISVHGEIDEDVGSALSLIIRNAAAQGGLRVLVIDLERCSFLAAAGVRSLLDGRRAAWERGCAYRVVNANGIVAQVLEAAGVPDLTHRLGVGAVSLDTSWWLREGL